MFSSADVMINTRVFLENGESIETQLPLADIVAAEDDGYDNVFEFLIGAGEISENADVVGLEVLGGDFDHVYMIENIIQGMSKEGLETLRDVADSCDSEIEWAQYTCIVNDFGKLLSYDQSIGKLIGEYDSLEDFVSIVGEEAIEEYPDVDMMVMSLEMSYNVVECADKVLVLVK